MNVKFSFLTFYLMAALIVVPVWAAEEPSEDETEGQSLTEVNKKLTNPVSDFWSVSFQQNNYRISTLEGFNDRWASNLNFQPMLPIALTNDWNLITRPVVTLFSTQPHIPGASGPSTPPEIHTSTAFGDTALAQMLSPATSISGHWMLGLGPTFIFPTASSDDTGQGKYQVGPAALLGYISKQWILGAFVQNWTSFAGNGDRLETNQMNFQPIAVLFLSEGWSLGYSGNILANWNAVSNNIWTVPLGMSVGKVVKFGKLPVKIGLAGQYMPIHPDNFGQKWNIQVTVTPVIPKLIKGTVFH